MACTLTAGACKSNRCLNTTLDLSSHAVKLGCIIFVSSFVEGSNKQDVPTESNAQNLDCEEAVKNIQRKFQETSLLDKDSTSETRVQVRCDEVDAGAKQNGSQVNRRLSADIKTIPVSVHSRVCVMLNVKRNVRFDDFRMLAEKVGLDRDETNFVEQLENPTDEILKTWSSKSEAIVGKLIELLKEKDLERMDVVKVLEDWVNEKQSE